MNKPTSALCAPTIFVGPGAAKFADAVATVHSIDAKSETFAPGTGAIYETDTPTESANLESVGIP